MLMLMLMLITIGRKKQSSSHMVHASRRAVLIPASRGLIYWIGRYSCSERVYLFNVIVFRSFVELVSQREGVALLWIISPPLQMAEFRGSFTWWVDIARAGARWRRPKIALLLDLLYSLSCSTARTFFWLSVVITYIDSNVWFTNAGYPDCSPETSMWYCLAKWGGCLASASASTKSSNDRII